MIRLFEEHQVRKTTELSSSLWDFSQVTDGKNTPVGKVMVPSCWESYPGFEAYRGQGLYECNFEADGDVRIVFKGVSHTAKVFVDGNQLQSITMHLLSLRQWSKICLQVFIS